MAVEQFVEPIMERTTSILSDTKREDLDATQLSKLLHHVQRERGASCAWASSGFSNGYFQIPEFRMATDAADGTGIVSERIQSVRDTVDGVVVRDATQFYAVFQQFCSLCEDMLCEQEAMFGSGPSSSPESATLCTFSRLKESVGRQRAFLCGALALPEKVLHTFSTRAFADLVVCVHQQKAYVQSLEENTPAALLEAVRPAFAKPDELAAVQKKLESDFDVAAVRQLLTVERCWEVHTEHMEMLRKIELQLHVAAVRSFATHQQQSAAVRALLQPAVRAAAHALGTDAASQLSKAIGTTPPTVLKEELLALLEQVVANGADAPAPAPAEPARSPLTCSTQLGGGILCEGEVEAGKRRRTGGVGVPTWEAANRHGGSPLGMRGEAKEKDGMEVEEHWLVGLGELELQRRIGVGSSGTTYLAAWRGATVAVKVAGSRTNDLSAWRAEVSALVQLRHPHIVQYLGAVVEPPTHCLVLEYCEGGDVRSALGKPTPPGFALHVAEGVASGMAYLHRKGIMHRDLKSANVLLVGASTSTIGTVKLTDFGVAVEVGHTVGPGTAPAKSELTAETGTLRWMAPEVARHEPYRKSADVFSFAMLCFELITHEVPFADRLPVMATFATSIQGLRPSLPGGTPAALAELVTRCWNATAAERPTFDQVREGLQALGAFGSKRLSTEERVWLDNPLGHRIYSSPTTTISWPGENNGQPVANVIKM